MKVLLIGLGRIGKLVARKMIAQDENKLDWVGAVEQTRDLELFSYLLNHDSTYGSMAPKSDTPLILLGFGSKRYTTVRRCLRSNQ